MDTRFTYKHFVNENTFSLLNPIFEATLLFAVLLLIIVIIKKVSIWVCLLFASLSVIVTGQLLWFSGIIADELNIEGSTKGFFCFVVMLLIHCAAIWISLMKSSKREKIPQYSEEI
ncbi:hypothetical protein FJQ98_06955 [Lysinibacillus agricola]|uniref:Uncharacterized protein n=1 Tax=Lysinibacillus agricola TaxID=2590012 RepID=A0ABX7AVB0_9BACI|nr:MULTISPECIES: hypothetical protein [Lysinibacillus]KOS62805.1 hypothetical protein AN161_10855 [Lysinibacillus sp. FJAT-14222]QQP13779.1 hypothetical protein FJQ98_06955 [Lysinibacillus agricola]